MYRRDQWKIIVPFLIPSLLIYVVFVLVPYFVGFMISFTRWTGTSLRMRWLGLYNYTVLVQDPHVWTALKNNLVFAFVGGALMLLLGMLVGNALSDSRLAGRHFYRTVFFFPHAMSVIAIAVLWMFIYNPQWGIFNGFLRLTGLGALAKPWLGETAYALPAVVVTHVWAHFGFYMVLFIAGIQQIPASLIEAATIDGASGRQVFRHIKLPLILEITKTALVFVIISGLNMFALVQVMTAGGPAHATETLGTYLYQKAFRENNFGYGSTVAALLFVVTLTISLSLQRFLKREVIEY